LNEVVKKFTAELDEDPKISFKANIKTYVRLYCFSAPYKPQPQTFG